MHLASQCIKPLTHPQLDALAPSDISVQDAASCAALGMTGLTGMTQDDCESGWWQTCEGLQQAKLLGGIVADALHSVMESHHGEPPYRSCGRELRISRSISR